MAKKFHTINDTLKKYGIKPKDTKTIEVPIVNDIFNQLQEDGKIPVDAIFISVGIRGKTFDNPKGKLRLMIRYF